jgi:hypothetical protein
VRPTFDPLRITLCHERIKPCRERITLCHERTTFAFLRKKFASRGSRCVGCGRSLHSSGQRLQSCGQSLQSCETRFVGSNRSLGSCRSSMQRADQVWFPEKEVCFSGAKGFERRGTHALSQVQGVDRASADGS